MKYEMQEMIIKPKTVKDLVKRQEKVVVDVTVAISIENTANIQSRSFYNVEFSNFEKFITTRVLHRLSDVLVKKFIDLVKSDVINLSELIQMKKIVLLKVSARDITDITYSIQDE